jgi:hypothetical protein
VERPTTLKHRGLMIFSDFETTVLSTRSTKSVSRKNAKANLYNLNAKADFSERLSLDFDDSSL